MTVASNLELPERCCGNCGWSTANPALFYEIYGYVRVRPITHGVSCKRFNSQNMGLADLCGGWCRFADWLGFTELPPRAHPAERKAEETGVRERVSPAFMAAALQNLYAETEAPEAGDPGRRTSVEAAGPTIAPLAETVAISDPVSTPYETGGYGVSEPKSDPV